MSKQAPFRSGFVAFIGRPNSGKSTLLNAVLGTELSPVTALPQTTRRRIKGVFSTAALQIVFLDTPGIHRGKYRLSNCMVAEAQAALDGVDCVCCVVDLSREPGEEEGVVAGIVQRSGAPVLMVFNKRDLCKNHVAAQEIFFSRFPQFAAAPHLTLSAIGRGAGTSLLAALDPFIKEGPRYFDDDALTDESMRFFAAELLRKQIILNTREEVPHAVFIEIESYRELEGRHEVRAVIHVETVGQRGIIIGAKGKMIGTIRLAAQKEISRLAGCPVLISCHVKVTPGWRDDAKILQGLYPQ